jgi:hypothetical protein
MLEPVDVRFGSKADICGATAHVCFTPNSDRESGFPQQAMSALPPKADMCGSARDVRYGPIANVAVSRFLKLDQGPTTVSHDMFNLATALTNVG